MITRKQFYNANPLDGGGTQAPFGVVDGTDCWLWETGIGTPAYKRWFIDKITVVNFTKQLGFYSVASGPRASTNPPGSFNRANQGLRSDPAAIASAPNLGPYYAYCQPIAAQTTRVMPVGQFMPIGQFLWTGASPGRTDFTFGGIGMLVSGWEYSV